MLNEPNILIPTKIIKKINKDEYFINETKVFILRINFYFKNLIEHFLIIKNENKKFFSFNASYKKIKNSKKFLLLTFKKKNNRLYCSNKNLNSFLIIFLFNLLNTCFWYNFVLEDLNKLNCVINYNCIILTKINQIEKNNVFFAKKVNFFILQLLSNQKFLFYNIYYLNL